jgi:hypothetical protein
MYAAINRFLTKMEVVVLSISNQDEAADDVDDGYSRIKIQVMLWTSFKGLDTYEPQMVSCQSNELGSVQEVLSLSPRVLDHEGVSHRS